MKAGAAGIERDWYLPKKFWPNYLTVWCEASGSRLWHPKEECLDLFLGSIVVRPQTQHLIIKTSSPSGEVSGSRLLGRISFWNSLFVLMLFWGSCVGVFVWQRVFFPFFLHVCLWLCICPFSFPYSGNRAVKLSANARPASIKVYTQPKFSLTLLMLTSSLSKQNKTERWAINKAVWTTTWISEFKISRKASVSPCCCRLPE